MNKRTVVLVILSCINSIFTPFSSASGKDKLISGHINSAPIKPLDYIFSQIVKVEEPTLRCALLIKIAAAHTRLKEYAESGDILIEAVGIAKNIENQLQRLILISAITDEFINLDKNEAAMELLRHAKDADARAKVLIKIISAHLRQNRYEMAESLMQEINKPASKALALYIIIDWLSTQKKYAELAKMQNIVRLQPAAVQKFLRLALWEKNKQAQGDPASDLFAAKTFSKKIRALIALAKNKFAMGDAEAADYILTEAVSLSENIKDGYIKDDCLAKIGICYIKIGMLKKAYALTHSIIVPLPRAELLAAIVNAYTEINEFEAALRVFGDIDVGFFKEKALVKIIIPYLEQGNKRRVSEIMERFENASARSRVYAAIIPYYLQGKNFTRALEISQEIEDPEIKMTALIEIAEELQKEKLNFPDVAEVIH